MDRLLELKEFCAYMALNDKQYSLDNDMEWNLVKSVYDSLDVVRKVTVKLQRADITLSEFFALFSQSIHRLSILEAKTDATQVMKTFCSNLIKCLQARALDKLLNNDLIIGCTFLDLRYNILLTDQQKEKAKKVLIELYCELREAIDNEQPNINYQPDPDNENISFGINNEHEDDLEETLLILERLQSPQREGQSNETNDRRTMIRNQVSIKIDIFSRERRLPQSQNIIKYWESRKSTEPELHLLAELLFAIPASQASVERNFSALAFIYNKHRNRLKGATLENILLIMLNSSILNLKR